MNNLKLQSFSKMIINTFLITIQSGETIEYNQWTELSGKIIDEDFENKTNSGIDVSEQVKEEIKAFTDLIPNS